jgi:hypothetical protein
MLSDKRYNKKTSPNQRTARRAEQRRNALVRKTVTDKNTLQREIVTEKREIAPLERTVSETLRDSIFYQVCGEGHLSVDELIGAEACALTILLVGQECLE